MRRGTTTKGDHMNLVVHTIGGGRASFDEDSDAIAHDGVLTILEHSSHPRKVTNFSMTSVIRWGKE